jgi:hypothetical protein
MQRTGHNNEQIAHRRMSMRHWLVSYAPAL